MQEGQVLGIDVALVALQVVAFLEELRGPAVFCRNGEGMLGDGVIWATPSNGAAAATVLNP